MTAPSRFQDLVGHAPVIARLRAAVSSDRLGSAYLLFGEPGIGKHTLAVIWARLLQCERPIGEPNASEPCGTCRSCRQHAAGSHPDWSVLEPEDSTVITIDQVRRLQDTLPYRPITSSRRVVLIPEAARLNPEASNALLKILEEPPVHAVFILVTAQRDRLLPTVLSRCQAVRCTAPPPEAVITHLTERLGVPAADASRLFAVAQGRIGPAIDAAANGEPAALSFDDVGAPDTISAPARLLDIAERVGKDQEALRALLAWLTLWLRDVLAWQSARDPARLLHRHRRTEVEWWARRLTVDDVMAAAAGVHALWIAVSRNLNPQLAAEVVLLHLSLRAGGPSR
ncbi:MAG: DNA polymerase III subunit delta' [Nitrospirota bacterium]